MPVSARLELMFGGIFPILGWACFGFAMCAVWTFGVHSDVTGPLFRSGVYTANATVTRVHATGASDGGCPVIAYDYRFTDSSGTEHSSVSYWSGTVCNAGSLVTVEYLAARPSVSRISGMRRAHFEWDTLLLVSVFPLASLAVILWVMLPAIRSILLLRKGKVAYGTIRSARRTSIYVNELPVYHITVSFMTDDGRAFEASVYTAASKARRHPKRTMLFYDPSNPRRVLLRDSLLNVLVVDDDGYIRARKPLAALGSALVPLAVLCVHGWYIYTRFIR